VHAYTQHRKFCINFKTYHFALRCGRKRNFTAYAGKIIKNIRERPFSIWGRDMIYLIMLPNFMKQNISKIKQINNLILQFFFFF
jgi:hypothetical protein